MSSRLKSWTLAAAAALVALGAVAWLVRRPVDLPPPSAVPSVRPPSSAPPAPAAGPASQPSAAPVPPPSTATDARSLFEAVERQRAEVRKKGLENVDYSPVPLLRGLKNKLPLLLAVRAFPDDAVRRYGPRAAGRDGASLEEREDAVEALGLLFEFGPHDAATPPLLDVAFGKEASLTEKAVEFLARRPQAGFIPALTARSDAGSGTAVEGLSLLSSDPRVAEYLRARLRFVVPAGTSSEFHRQKRALEAAVERLDLLRSPDGADRVVGLLENAEGRVDADDLRWAIGAAATGRDPKLLEALRRRVDRLYESHSAWFKSPDAMNSEIDVPGAFDECLWVLYRTGGPLRDIERNRLRHFGLIGDAREALRSRGLWREP